MFSGRTGDRFEISVLIETSNANRSSNAAEFALGICRELRSTESRRVPDSFHFESPFSIDGNIYRYLCRAPGMCPRAIKAERRYICKDEHLQQVLSFHGRGSASFPDAGKNSRYLYRARSFARALLLFFFSSRGRIDQRK